MQGLYLSAATNTTTMSSHQDEETLRRLHHEERLSTREMADELGCHFTTVIRWMDRHGIERRDISEAMKAKHADKPVPFRCLNGYPAWQGMHCGDREVVTVHRLAAVAWFGWDAVVAADDVHHTSGFRLDNREDALELLSKREHRLRHTRQP